MMNQSTIDSLRTMRLTAMANGYGKLDELLIRTLAQQEAYDLLEVIESRSQKGSIIFCTQYETEGWYKRINPDPNDDSPISEAIMDRIIIYLFQ